MIAFHSFPYEWPISTERWSLCLVLYAAVSFGNVLASKWVQKLIASVCAYENFWLRKKILCCFAFLSCLLVLITFKIEMLAFH